MTFAEAKTVGGELSADEKRLASSPRPRTGSPGSVTLSSAGPDLTALWHARDACTSAILRDPRLDEPVHLATPLPSSFAIVIAVGPDPGERSPRGHERSGLSGGAGCLVRARGSAPVIALARAREDDRRTFPRRAPLRQSFSRAHARSALGGGGWPSPSRVACGLGELLVERIAANGTYSCKSIRRRPRSWAAPPTGTHALEDQSCWRTPGSFGTCFICSSSDPSSARRPFILRPSGSSVLPCASSSSAASAP
jgi:hypothetical protein